MNQSTRPAGMVIYLICPAEGMSYTQHILIKFLEISNKGLRFPQIPFLYSILQFIVLCEFEFIHSFIVRYYLA